MLITSGALDKDIKKSISEKLNRQQKKNSQFCAITERVISITFCTIFCILLLTVGVLSCVGDTKVKKIPAIKVIPSTSMSEKYENNTYLFDNNLNDQIKMFDLVILNELPKEEDLQLYDIVVYEHISGTLLIHRIVGIEEPNESHPNERYFLLQGDAVHYPDSFPVRQRKPQLVWK